MAWKKYSKERLIQKHESGFFIIKPESYTHQTQPYFCSICEAVMKSAYDEDAWKKFGCCDKCASSWAYPNIEQWKSGWRPTKEEVQNKARHNEQ